MATNTWNDAAADNKLSTAGNWSLGHAPISTDAPTIVPSKVSSG